MRSFRSARAIWDMRLDYAAMCALILLHRTMPGFPTVLAANRDEFKDRPAAPPQRVDARVPYLAPVDLRAGGTWIGTNAAGLTVAITNRRALGVEPPDPSLSSRGAIVREALEFGGAAAAARLVSRSLESRRTNPFHLLLADAHDAFLLRRSAIDARPESVRLAPGAHVVTNLHELDAIEFPGVAAIAAEAGALPLLEVVARLAEILKRTEPIAADGFAPCKDLGDRGTRSSTIIARGDGHGLFLHADGPPDRTPYLDWSADLRAISGPATRQPPAS